MSRCQKDPVRPLTSEEGGFLEKLARAQSEPASHVARALLAVAAGQSDTAAAHAAGRVTRWAS